MVEIFVAVVGGRLRKTVVGPSTPTCQRSGSSGTFTGGRWNTAKYDIVFFLLSAELNFSQCMACQNVEAFIYSKPTTLCTLDTVRYFDKLNTTRKAHRIALGTLGTFSRISCHLFTIIYYFCAYYKS